MDLDLNPNKVCAELVTTFIKDTFHAGLEFGEAELKKLSIAFETAFKNYLARNTTRLEKIKTILDPSTPILLMSIFEPPLFEMSQEDIETDEFLSKIEQKKFTVITGTGGSGKSVFLRYAFLRYAKENRGRIPIFVELRLVLPEETLTQALLRELNIKCDFDQAGIEYALSAGKFLILLDALDEVEEAQRERISNEIKELSYKYENNQIILTSRPSENFLSWNEFQVAEICPFSKDQVVSLITKLQYEQVTKEAFLKEIEKELYETHHSYLSNPLLCIIMLMTFDQGAGIPAKRHLFFDLAFDVLFFKHDSTKTGYYRRLFQTGLDIDKFKNVFGTFSAFSYIGKGSSFMRSEAIGFAKDALDYDCLDKDPDHLVNDLVNRMCLLIAEGSRLSYIHRSFQEFFAAHFIAYRNFENWEGIVHQVVLEKPNDNVVSMLQEMIPARFEEKYLLPRLEAALAAVAAVDKDTNPAALVELFYLGFGLRSENRQSISFLRFKEGTKTSEYHYLHNIFYMNVSYNDMMFGADDWSEFLKIAPEAKKTDHGIEFVFRDLSSEAIKRSPIFDKIVAFAAMLEARRDEINENIARKDRLVQASIVEKLVKKAD